MTKHIITRISFITLLICSTFILKGQDWLSGFVVLNNQDTVRGKVQYRTSDVQFQKCFLKKEGAVQEYSPADVLGYGIDGVKSYSSQALKNEFAEIVAIGNVSLFKQRKTFLIQNESGETYPLASKTETVAKDGDVYVSEGKKWKSVLFGMISSCDVTAEDLKDLNFNQKNILELISRYNQCKNGQTQVYTHSGLNKVLVDFGIQIGRRNGELNVSSSNGVLRPIDANHKSSNMLIGGFANLRFPNFSEKISLQIGLNYQTVSLSANTTFSNATDPNRTRLIINKYETLSEFSAIGIPISLKGLLVEGAVSIYVQSGLVFNQITSPKSTRIQVMTIDNGAPTTTQTSNVLDFKSNETHLWARIGASKNINGQFKVGLAFDFVFSNDQLLLNNNKFSPFRQSGISLILSR